MLRDAVRSALAQGYGNIEVIVGDNAASREVRDWCEAMRERDARLRYQCYERNLGMAGNWNALADAAQGEFFVLLADDDRLCPEFVSTLLSAVQQYKADVGFSNHYVINGDGARLDQAARRFTDEYFRRNLPAGVVNDPESCVWRNSISIAACLLRTSDVRQVRFKEDLNTPELEFFVRLFQQQRRLVFSPAYLSEYRIHAASGTASGLWTERLASYLVAVTVRADVEPLKRQLLRPLLITAVNRCLERGDRASAKTFLASPYYPHPRWAHPQGIVQTLCALVPPAFAKPILGLSRTVYRRRARLQVSSRNISR
jgi:glycosyltransferase involved in cell wall biosynthesis